MHLRKKGRKASRWSAAVQGKLPPPSSRKRATLDKVVIKKVPSSATDDKRSTNEGKTGKDTPLDFSGKDSIADPTTPADKEACNKVHAKDVRDAPLQAEVAVDETKTGARYVQR